MYIQVWSASLQGIYGYPTGIQVSLNKGMPSFNLIGRPDNVVRESRMRITAALKSVDLRVSNKKVIVNLTPSHLAKRGAQFDLAIAAALMSLLEGYPEVGEKDAFIGELSLDGSVCGVPGLFSMIECLMDAGIRRFFIPETQKDMANYFPEADFYFVGKLRDLKRRPSEFDRFQSEKILLKRPDYEVDYGDIMGHALHKRAMMAAAASGHHVLLVGPPGTGKSLLARRLHTILPMPDEDDFKSILKIHGSQTQDLSKFECRPPFRMPGSDLKRNEMTGTANGKIGEVTLANAGVLYLEEISEFRQEVIDALKRPLDDGWIDLGTPVQNTRYPARFTLLATANPCPCGYYGTEKPCTCQLQKVHRHQLKYRGPVGDRLDIRLYTGIQIEENLSQGDPLNSEWMRARVDQAVLRQLARYGSKSIRNTNVPMSQILETFNPPAIKEDFRVVFKERGFSHRNMDQVYRLARTLADLDDEVHVGSRHLSEGVALHGGF